MTCWWRPGSRSASSKLPRCQLPYERSSPKSSRAGIPSRLPGSTSKATTRGPNADPARVRQILRNLITNALRYGGDDIEVDVGTDRDAVFLEVRDDGPGLPGEEWERIFEPYYRFHSERSQPGSVGLGLTVARGLAELMDGNLTYRYYDGQSIFTLRLPRAAN